MEAIVRESLSIQAERYSIVILDSENGTLLDYARMGELPPTEAAEIVWKLYQSLSSVYGRETPIEADIVTPDRYVKIVSEPEAGIVRGVVTTYAPSDYLV